MSKQNKSIKIPQALIDRRKILEAELKRLKDGLDQVNARVDELTANILLINDVDIQSHRVVGFTPDGSEIIIQKIEDNGTEERKAEPAGKGTKPGK